jgi:hypothetical protein
MCRSTARSVAPAHTNVPFGLIAGLRRVVVRGARYGAPSGRLHGLEAGAMGSEVDVVVERSCIRGVRGAQDGPLVALISP